MYEFFRITHPGIFTQSSMLDGNVEGDDGEGTEAAMESSDASGV
jgi:hypothetical protein